MALNSNFRTLTADNIEGIVDDRNYLKSSFENGTITGWTEVAVALTSGLPTGTPTIGATAASSLALSATSVTPLSGSRSLLVDVPSALTAGHGFISDEFTLDRMDLGKVLTVSFDYERVTGTYNFSGTLGSQTWMVYIYDATLGAANWIQPAGFLGMNQSSGPGRVRATFQSSVTAGQKYRVAVIASQAAAGASSIEFDNFTCSRQTAPIGPVVTDWVSYTPTGGWTTNTTYTGRWRRVGDSMEVQFGVALTGAPNAAALSINLPSGHSVDTSKLPTGSLMDVAGSGQGLKSGTGYILASYLATVTSVQISFIVNGASPAENNLSNTAPVSWANGDIINGSFRVPIIGWSSQVQLSNDTDTRVVAFNANVTTASVGINSTVTCALSSVLDTHNGISGGSSYVIPVSGIYELSASGWVGTGSATLSDRNIYIDVDGVTVVSSVEASGFGTNHSPFVLRRLNAGQVITWKIGNGAVAINSVNVIVNASRLSGPSVVAASESVSAICNTSAGQSIPFNVETIVIFGNKVFDSHNSMNSSTGIYTVPISGQYEVSGSVYFSTAITATATDVQFLAYRNGAAYLATNTPKSGNAATPLVTYGTIKIRCNAGDTLSVAIRQNNSASTAQSLLANAAFNWVAISRVGN